MDFAKSKNKWQKPNILSQELDTKPLWIMIWKIRKKWAHYKVCEGYSVPIDLFQRKGFFGVHLCIFWYICEGKSWHKSYNVLLNWFGHFWPSKRDHLRFISNISICKVWILEKSVEIDRIHCVRFSINHINKEWFFISFLYDILKHICQSRIDTVHIKLYDFINILWAFWDSVW